MGAWSSDPFGNDTAGDWKYGLDDVDDFTLIEKTIQKVLDFGDDYIEAPDAEEAIAAIDTIARLKGRFYIKNAYTESVDNWVASHPLIPTTSLIEKANKALDRILSEPSEILELWGEGEDFEAWRNQIEDLKNRIK
jgi:hypothetical protein